MTDRDYDAIAGGAMCKLLFVCDHASNALPEEFGTLGLDPSVFATHIAYDIGAANITCNLALAYNAPAILGRWSRLLIDLNRGSDDPTIVTQLSDGIIVPANRSLSVEETARRISSFHLPYHAAIDCELDRIGAEAIIVSIHSFTPRWKGKPRMWEVGVLYDRDTRISAPLMQALALAGFIVGDNEPYSGALEGDTLYRHGTMRGLPHVLIEIRQDLIITEDLAAAFSRRLKPILDEALQAMRIGPQK